MEYQKENAMGLTCLEKVHGIGKTIPNAIFRLLALALADGY